MAKKKKNSRFDSDGVHAKKSAQNSETKKINPFEIHQNKEKFKIIGRTCKHDHGLPGVSRSKALKRRQETLGEEYEKHHKTNKFTDKRIGRSFNGFNDDIANARYTADKIENFKKNKSDLYNLNDDVVLTHKGVTIEDIEEFRDSGSDDDLNDDDDALNAEFTDIAHFGRGGTDPTDRQTAIDEMIANAKRKKAETMKEKNEIYNLTTKLDEDYKKLIPLIGKFSKIVDDPKAPPDDYDRALKEMIFEPRGEVSDRLQSEEEIAKKEKERLERLEDERLSRMKDQELGIEKPKHRSADDLDDGYLIGSDQEEEPTLAYDLNGEQPGNMQKPDEDKEMENDEMAIEEHSSEEIDDSDENSDSEDNLSDLNETESESEEVNHTKTEQKEKKSKISTNKNLQANADKELPFIYEMPVDYNEFSKLLFEQNADYQNVIIERIIKCNHPKLDGKNREKIVNLFDFIMQHINEVFSNCTENNIENSFKILDKMTPHLFDLVNLNPEKISIKLIEIVKEKYMEFKKNEKKYPDLNTIVLFKIISNLYSTSDFRHPIVTPCFIFISHILSKGYVQKRKDIASGLLLVTIVLEFTQLSKRFLPAVLNFLQGIIFLSIPKRKIEIIKIIPPFQSTGQFNNLLSLENDEIHEISEEKLTAKDLVQLEIDENFKILTINTTFKLIKDFIELLNENVGIGYFSEPFLNITEKLNLDNYPKFVQLNWELLHSDLIAATKKTLHKLVPIVRKPKALRLLEPRIERIYDDKRRPKMSKEKEMRSIMAHKIKRETKGAVREIRRDNEFLQNIRIQNQIKSDIERKEKVRRIYAEASVQQGELNALSRNKKKEKF